MNELSLFTGAGGGLLGSILLGWKTIGAVEIEEYPCKVLEQRQRDGILDAFPIWQMDIREFNRRIAPIYKGVVDVVTAGFPCQPFSVAGKQRAEQDERNMWPHTIECIRLVQPQYAFLENVPGLLATGYIRRVYGDLAEAGYNAQWCVLGADNCGAPHHRKRLWIFAYTQECGNRGALGDNQTPERKNRAGSFKCKSLARKNWHHTKGRPTHTPNLLCMAHGVAHRMDRLKAIGNGQVPRVVKVAWEVLSK